MSLHATREWRAPSAELPLVDGGLILCERRARWIVHLAQVAPALATAARNARNLPDARDLMVQQPSSVLAWAPDRELGAPEGEWLAKLGQRFPRAVILLLGVRASDDAIWSLREMGVIAVIETVAEVQRLARLTQRHWLRFPPAQHRTPGERLIDEWLEP